jgi:hypothetical protein
MGFIIEGKATVRDDASAKFVLSCLPAFQADNVEVGAHDEGNVVFEQVPLDLLGSVAHRALDQIHELLLERSPIDYINAIMKSIYLITRTNNKKSPI